MTIPPIASFTVTPGSADVSVPEDGVVALAPGSYDEATFGPDSTITLQACTYDFRTLPIEPDVVLDFNTAFGDAFVNTESALAFGDRTEITVTGPGKVAFYTNATGTA